MSDAVRGTRYAVRGTRYANECKSLPIVFKSREAKWNENIENYKSGKMH